MSGSNRDSQPLLSSSSGTLSYGIDVNDGFDPLKLLNKRKSLEELDEIKRRAAEDDSENLLKLKVAIYGSVAANVLLFLLQLYAAVTSGSLSLFATMADAFMDLLSSVILLLAGKAAERKNHFKYPTGKSRLETAGIIVFSALMSTVSVQLMIEGVKSLYTKQSEINLEWGAILCVVFALITKFFLYIYCVALSQYPSAKILALDHRNDIIVNLFGLSMSLLGHNLYWWIDPVGCLLVALIILRSWVSTALEQIELIVGKSADPAFLQRLTYLAITHDPRIVQVDTCRAYHVGNNVFVEVDIVLDPQTPLRESHDIGETLQVKFEKIPEVERAFVHLDYESFHRPEHQAHEFPN